MSAFQFPFVRGKALWIFLNHIPCLETKTTGLHEPALREGQVRIPVTQTCINPTSHLRVLFSYCLYATFLLHFVILDAS